MRLFFSGLALLGLVIIVGGSADAGGKDKEVTLKGKIACAKCELNESKTCATVIVVKREKKDVVIFFDAKSHKEHHDKICTEAKAGSVTGTVKKDGKKEIVSVKELKFE